MKYAPETLPLRTVGGLALAKLGLHLLTNGQYGYHRDELYYLASGAHPAAGYVDYPPITPLLARLNVALLPESAWTLRLFPSLAGACIVVLAAILARDLGGRRVAQVLASLAAATSLVLLGANWLFQTVSFDQLCWVATLVAFTRMLRTRDPRLWLLVGGLLGIGFETKLTILGLGAGIGVAVLTSMREQLRTPWPWAGLLLALTLAAPHIWWQIDNGWPTLEYVRNHNAVIQSAGAGLSINFDSGGALVFVAFQPLIVGPLTLPLWFLGWFYLLRSRTWRPLGIASAVAYVLFLLVGKAYYPGPLVPVLFAAGCVQLEALAMARRWTRALPIAASTMVLQLIVLLPLGVPVIPQSAMAATHLDTLRSDFADTVGWPEFTLQIASVYQQLDPSEQQHTTILAGNYGEAGAIRRFGGALGLPQAVSPELTFWYWKPSHVDAESAIAVGISEQTLRRLFAEVTRITTLPAVDSVQNSEVDNPVFLCRKPLVSLDAAWPALRNFS